MRKKLISMVVGAAIFVSNLASSCAVYTYPSHPRYYQKYHPRVISCQTCHRPTHYISIHKQHPKKKNYRQARECYCHKETLRKRAFPQHPSETKYKKSEVKKNKEERKAFPSTTKTKDRKKKGP